MDQWPFRRKRLKKKSVKGEDFISELPDDILVHIVSLLTLKEAGALSVLSNRWRYVWAYTPYLNFDVSEIIEGWWKNGTNKKKRKKDECRYYTWVGQAVGSHMASIIDEFRICLDLRKNHKEKMDNWLKFAIQKRVKRLELNIAPFKKYMSSYTFPSILSLCCNSLTSLQLSYVDVTGEVLENFLCNCPTLESISVDQSKSLVSLIVTGPSLNLKYLKIRSCFKIKIFEIHAPNLTSCYYSGHILETPPFKSTPKLSKLHIGGASATQQFSSFSDISSCVSVIEELTLEASFKVERVAQFFPVCIRLKKLHVVVDPGSSEELFRLRFLLKACPVLEKFVLQLELTDFELKRTRKTNKFEACAFDHLKIVEIVGFVGWKVVTAFTVYLIKNAVSLEKIIIEPIQEIASLDPDIREMSKATEKAQQLHLKYNQPGTEVEIR